MASSQADIRSHASALLNLCARKKDTARVLIERGFMPVILTACNDADARVVKIGIGSLLRCVRAADEEGSAHLQPAILQACTAAAFPSASFSRLGSAGRLTDSFSQLILAVSLVLGWSESAVDSARLHPLAQRLVDAGLMPHIEGHDRHIPDAGDRRAERAADSDHCHDV
jgi:hypothetical protein